MRESKPDLEVAALKAALDSPDKKVRAILLGGFKFRTFGYAPSIEIYSRISTLIKNAKELPASHVLAQDPALTTAAQTLLAGPALVEIRDESDARTALDTLRQYDNGRVLFHATQNITGELAQEVPDIELVRQEMETALTQSRNQDQEEKLFHFGLGDNTKDVINRILNKNLQDIFMPTGFRGFDKKAGGLAKSNFMVAACHRKGGKSIMLLNLGLNMYYSHGYSGCIVTLEMGEDEYAGRLLSNLAGVPYTNIRLKKLTRGDHARINQAYENFIDYGKTNNCRFTIWPTVSTNLQEIGLLLRPYGFNFVIIDYLNLLSHDEPQEWKRLSELARECKILTGVLGCPVIAATQMDTTGSVIRYSRAIEEHADYIWKWVYGEAEETSGIIDVEQLVSRHTERFNFKLRADFEHMRIKDYEETPSEAEQARETSHMGMDYMDDL